MPDKFTVSFLSFSLGYLGFCYEIFFSRLAAIFVGGSFFQLTILIGLFTFCMGLASLGSAHLGRLQKKILIFGLILQLFLLSAVLFFIYFKNPILNQQNFWFFLACIFGFITGSEIPTLIHVYKNNTEKILAFDYVGLFLAALVFPLYILKYFSVYEILIQFIICILILFAILRAMLASDDSI